MSKGRSIKATELANKTKITPTPIEPSHVSLSFKYLECEHGKFHFKSKQPDYFIKLLERFRDVCRLTFLQMHTTHKDSLRCHSHDWIATTEKGGFKMKGQLADCLGWQFQISSNEHGRVHGFFVGQVFFVIWLDPDQSLYE